LSGTIGDRVDGRTAAERAAIAIGRNVVHYDGDDLRYSADFDHYCQLGQLTKYSEADGLENELDIDDLVLDPDWYGAED